MELEAKFCKLHREAYFSRCRVCEAERAEYQQQADDDRRREIADEEASNYESDDE